MAVKFTNNAVTTLTASISIGATSFAVASNTGFPTISGSDYTYLTVGEEVVKVTGISGTTFTCDAVSSTHSSGDNVELRMTSELLTDFATDLEAMPKTGGTFTGAVSMSANKITNLDTPTATTDATTKAYVDGVVGTNATAIALNTAKTGITSGQASAITANTSKVTNATHTGEVTGATTLTIANNIIDEANLKVSNAPTNGYSLTAQSSASGGLTWAEVGLADDSVTTAKIVNDAVTEAKLANAINSAIAANTAKTGITSGQASAITANTAKSTNVTTNLSTTTTSTTNTVVSSDGTNAVLPAATTSVAGMQTAADKTKLNGIATGATANVGDITGVTAGSGMSGGGTSGTVTLTNSSPNIVQTTVSGNAGTATTLATARTIAGVSFNGSANISLNNNAITNGAGYTTNTGDITNVGVTSPITGGGSSGSVTIAHSTAAGNKHIPTGGSSGQFLKYSASGTAVWATVTASAIPAGSVMSFFQSSAPTGWTKVTSQNNKVLRVVSGTGGGTGGTWATSSGVTTSTIGSHTHTSAAHTHTGASHTHTSAGHTHSTTAHTLSIAEMPAHTHYRGPYTPGSAAAYAASGYNSFFDPASTQTTSTGGGGSHTHGNTGSTTPSATGATTPSSGGSTTPAATGSAGGHSHTISAPQYIDVIICSKD